MGTPYISEIRIMSFNYPPKGWAMCNGQIMAIQQNQALFSLLGTTYGGDGIRTFALPNLQGRVPIHMGTGYTLGQIGGEVAHTLILSELPAHNHIPAGSSNPAGVASPANNLWAAQSSGAYAPTSDTSLSSLAMAHTGGSQPHDNMSPYLVLNFCIALQGIFPSRN